MNYAPPSPTAPATNGASPRPAAASAPRTPLLARIQRASDDRFQLIRALVYGDSGMGKTTSLRTLPEDCTLIAVAERGLVPLRDTAFAVVPLSSWADCTQLIEELRNGMEITPGVPLRCLAIDSLSAISELCKREIVERDRPALLKERKDMKKLKGDIQLGIYDDQLSMEDWGLYGTRMKNFIAALCQMPFHIVCTCLAQWTEDKQTGTQYRTPNLSGRLALECPAYFDLVMHMESVRGEGGQNERLWKTFNDGKVLAKDASGVLEPFEDPNWKSVIVKIRSGKRIAAEASPAPPAAPIQAAAHESTVTTDPMTPATEGTNNA